MRPGDGCVVLLSGGLDSVVTTAVMVEAGAHVLALTFDYGQRAAGRELASSSAVAGLLGCEWRALELPWLGDLSTSPLTDPHQEMPRPVEGGDLDEEQAAEHRARAVWVPNRNGVFVAVAGAVADALDYDFIALGLNREEGAHFADNTPYFAAAATSLLAWSTLRKPQVLGPTAHLDKAEIAALGLSLGAPLKSVWSCYHGAEGHCWECESCRRLKRALEAAGAWPGEAPS